MRGMSKPVLHYAMSNRRRRLLKRMVWGLLAVTAIVATFYTWHHRGRIAAQYEAIGHQRIVENHLVPEDRVLYESPELDGSFDATEKEMLRVLGAQPWLSAGIASYVAAPQALPFMGMRSTPSGEQRIVIVDSLFIQVGGDGYHAMQSYEVWAPGTYLKLPQHLRTSGTAGGDWVSHPHVSRYPSLIVHIGQPDAADPTRINFRFVSGRQEGVYVLRLNDADELVEHLEFTRP